VLGEFITSIAAIEGLLAVKFWNISYVDAAAALISSLVILKWSFGILKSSGKELIPFYDWQLCRFMLWSLIEKCIRRRKVKSIQ